LISDEKIPFEKMFKLRSVFSGSSLRCIHQGFCVKQGFYRGLVSQPAASPIRISNNSKKANRNVARVAKKKKGIRDILGDDIKSPAAPLSAPSPMVVFVHLIKDL
jgi:hypothetical protein